MTHHTELAGKYLTSSHSSTYQAHNRHGSEGDREFSFWNSSNTISSYNDCDHQLGEEAYKRKDFKAEHSTLLPGRSHHCCSTASDPSRSKAIAEGRKELMEMMEGMPESSFELSFQDMVLQKQHLQTHQDETCEDKTFVQSNSSNNKVQTKKPKQIKKSKSNNRPGQIMRVESMDSESFLLKMFFPTSLKKVSRRPSFQESAKQEGKDWRVKHLLQEGDNNRGHTEDGISKNTRSSSDKSRHLDRNVSFSQGCLPFFQHTKSIRKKVGG